MILDRAVPLLAFLATVVVLAELVAEAEVFDVLAAWLARTARGSGAALFVAAVALACLTTVTLNLDTTAVLLTPVLLSLAVRIGAEPLPLAMTTVWLANTASLLLPVSNLTNLLAAGRVGLSPVAFAARLALLEAAAVLVTAAMLWLLYWRGTGRYRVPERHRTADPLLCWIAALATTVFLAGVLLDVPLPAASASGCALVVAAFAARRRSALSLRLVPWRVLALVAVLFAVVDVAASHGLADVLRPLISGSPWRAAGVGAVSANLANNLPAYLAGEAAVGSGHREVLLGLLVGVNVGPLVTPWASLATLIWFQHCRSAGVRVPLTRFAAHGALLAVCAVGAATAALQLAG